MEEQIATPDECCPVIQGTSTVFHGRLYVPGVAEELVAADTVDGTVLWWTTVVDEDYVDAIPSTVVKAEAEYVNTYHGARCNRYRRRFDSLAVRRERVQSTTCCRWRWVVMPRNDAVLAYEKRDSHAWTNRSQPRYCEVGLDYGHRSRTSTRNVPGLNSLLIVQKVRRQVSGAVDVATGTHPTV